MTAGSSAVSFTVNGDPVTVASVVASGGTGGDRPLSLLDVLRGELGLMSVKDGCSPQGQCGCCTVLVDGQPRVACVTPVRRVSDRSITTLEGLSSADRWADAFCAAGASQCGFCTPGIIMRLEGAAERSGHVDGDGVRPSDGFDDGHVDDSRADEAVVDQALLAHLCRCTGWQTIGEAWRLYHRSGTTPTSTRNLEAAGHRATLEGGAAQLVGPAVARGEGGFAADTAPSDALIAVRAADGGWVVGESLAAARAEAGKVQGRRTTVGPSWPLALPPGDWPVTLRTTWVDPAYLETDASWCEPGGEPSTPTANGGAFGAKPISAGAATESERDLDVATVARRLADAHDHPVLVLASREDVARLGPKRPPVAAGMTNDGRAWIRVAETAGIAEAIRAGLALAGLNPASGDDEIRIEEVPVPGPPTSAAIRAAGWAEAMILHAGALGRPEPIRTPSGAEAEAEIDLGGPDPVIRVSVRCGRILDEVVLRSYCIGAAHMAWSWLTSEALSVDDAGLVHDLTVRSFGVLRAVDTPFIDVQLHPSDDDPVNGSDAVFVAVAAAGWLARGCPQDWPIGR